MSEEAKEAVRWLASLNVPWLLVGLAAIAIEVMK